MAYQYNRKFFKNADHPLFKGRKWVEAMRSRRIGKKHSPETKLKISKQQKGQPKYKTLLRLGLVCSLL